MNRSFDIFRMSANGVDPDRGTARVGQMRARTNHPADPPFGHGVLEHEHDHEWHAHPGAQPQYESSSGYARPQEEPPHPRLWDRVKGAFSGKGPKNYVRSDARIHEDVCDHLSDHPYVDASEIEVVVRDGEVTLTGTVEARLTKRAAEDCCDHVRGVKDVHNHLRVARY